MEKLLEKATIDLDDLYYRNIENIDYEDSLDPKETPLHKKLYTLMSEKEADKLSDEISRATAKREEFGYRLGFKQAFKLFKEVFQNE